MSGDQPGEAKGGVRGGPLRRALTWLLPIVITVALVYFVWRERTRFGGVFEAPPGDIILICALVVAGSLLNAAEFRLLYSAAGARPGLGEMFLWFSAGQLANHLPGQIGSLYRLRYMRVVHGVTYVRSAAVYGANLVVTLGGAAIAGLMGIVGVLSIGGGLPVAVSVVFLGALACVVVIAVVPLPRMRRLPHVLGRLWSGLRSGLDDIRSVPRAGVMAIALECVKYGATAWRFQLAFALVQVHHPIWVFLVLAPAAGVAGFISPTPAALGLREIFITGAAVGMGIELTSGLVGATVDRAAMLLIAATVGSLALLVTYRRMRAFRVDSTADFEG